MEILIVARDDCTRTRFHRHRKVSGKLDVSASHTCVYFYGFHTLFMDFIFLIKSTIRTRDKQIHETMTDGMLPFCLCL